MLDRFSCRKALIGYIYRQVITIARFMKWHNSKHDALPDTTQEVLVCVRGVYHITIYDPGDNLFRLRSDPSEFFDPGVEGLYWMDVSVSRHRQ